MHRLTVLIEPAACVLIAAVCCLFLGTNSALAGPPFITDDPEPPPPGGWEINMPFIVQHTAAGTELDTPLLDLNYGLPDLQLKFEIPIRIERTDQNHAAGFGDPLVGVKWRFLSNEKSGLEVGTYPQVQLPVGDHRRGLGEGHAAYLLPLLIQKSWKQWTGYAEIGHWWHTAAEGRNSWFAGAALERDFTQRVSFGAELFSNTPQEQGGRAEVGFNVGGTLKLNRHTNLLWSTGRNIVGSTHFAAYFGLQFMTK